MEKYRRKGGGRENRDIAERRLKRKIQLPFRDVGCHWSSSTGNMIGKKAVQSIETPEIRVIPPIFSSFLVLSLFHWKYLLKISRKRRFFLENVVEKYIIWNDERSLFKKGEDRKGTNNFFYSQNLWQKKKRIKNKKKGLKFVDIIKNFLVLNY